jgi:hypothetical protein
MTFEALAWRTVNAGERPDLRRPILRDRLDAVRYHGLCDIQVIPAILPV